MNNEQGRLASTKRKIRFEFINERVIISASGFKQSNCESKMQIIRSYALEIAELLDSKCNKDVISDS